jgi:thiol-disulfide isomerase/thioredoxin
MDRKTTYAVIAVLLIIAVGLLIYFNIGPAKGKYLVSYINQPVPQSLINELNVSGSVSNRVGAGAVGYYPQKISAPPLTNDSKPEVLYIGADYCPYCAATRWGLIIALSRFGTFSNLHYMISNTSDVYAGTPTFTFYNSSYTSNYITFTAVETSTQNKKPLQTPTPSQAAIFGKYAYPPYVPAPGGGIPLIDFGNMSIQDGAPIDPSLLQYSNWTQIAHNLTVLNSTAALGVVGSADVFTAQICRMTNFTPSNVCSQPYISSILGS